MDLKVQNGIRLIGYTHPITTAEFDKIIEEGAKNTHFTQIVCFIANELRSLCGIDEKVNPITCPEDSQSFLMELSSFLKELGCRYESLVQGHISERLTTKEERLLLLDYLLTELMSARMLHETVPEKKIELKLNETNNAANLRKILMTLGFSKPPPNITVKQLFQKLMPSIENAIKKGGSDLIGNPIFNLILTEKQWDVISGVQKDMHHEYTIRREMLLKRLDCTVQSFQWSDKTKGKEAELNKKYTEKRKELKVEPDVSLSDLMSAREDLAIIEKTSSASVRKNTQSSINKVLIGQVPDRGGRTSEQAPPPPEMPSWQQRTAGPPGGGGRGRGRGGYGSGDRGGRDTRNDYNNRGNASNNYNTNYNQRSNNASFDSAGTYNQNRVSNNSFKEKSYSDGSYNDNYNKNYNESHLKGGYDNYSRNSGGYESYGSGSKYSGGFDSAGSYGGYQEYQTNEPKRAKTYDYFQTNKSTYADQYVQESQHNQQYQSREYKNRGRGKSNYNRGNNRGYY